MAQWLHFVASLAQGLIPSSKKSHQVSLQNILFLIYSLNLFEGHFYNHFQFNNPGSFLDFCISDESAADQPFLTQINGHFWTEGAKATFGHIELGKSLTPEPQTARFESEQQSRTRWTMIHNELRLSPTAGVWNLY